MLANLVEESVNAPGTATSVNLGGAVTGRVGFVTAFGSGATCFYFMSDGTIWECGYGVVTSGSPNTFSRDVVLDNSSGTTARLNFTGTTRIYSRVPAEREMYLAAATAGPLAIVSPLIDSRVYQYTDAQNLTTIVPLDDTVPTSTEGDQIISQSWTPRSATSRIRLEFSGVGATSLAANWSAALFAGTTCLAAGTASCHTANANAALSVAHEYVPGATSAITFSVRVGIDRTGSVTFNGFLGPTRYFGGVGRMASLQISEFAA